MNDTSNKTHYRKAFNSPYLSSADITEPINLTISHVKLRGDETKKTKDFFNTAYFIEKEIRAGERLKPMILNATNSRVMANISNSAFIDDWNNIVVVVFVDKNVRFGRNTVEGLRLGPAPNRPLIIKGGNSTMWDRAVMAYKRDGNFNQVLKHADISPECQQMIIEEIKNETV